MARTAGRLVLIGGRTGAEVEGHDWERILTLTGLLHRDHQVVSVVHVAGVGVMLGALAWGTWTTLRGRR